MMLNKGKTPCLDELPTLGVFKLRWYGSVSRVSDTVES